MKNGTYYIYAVIAILFFVIACKKGDLIDDDQNKVAANGGKRNIKVLDDPSPSTPEVASIGWNPENEPTGSCSTAWRITKQTLYRNPSTGAMEFKTEVLIENKPGTCSVMPQNTAGGLPEITFPCCLVAPPIGPITPNYGYYFTVYNLVGTNSAYFSTHYMNEVIIRSMDEDIAYWMPLVINEDQVLPYNSNGMEAIRYATLGALAAAQFGANDCIGLITNMPYSSNSAGAKQAFLHGINYVSTGGSLNMQAMFTNFTYQVQSNQIYN